MEHTTASAVDEAPDCQVRGAVLSFHGLEQSPFGQPPSQRWLAHVQRVALIAGHALCRAIGGVRLKVQVITGNPPNVSTGVKLHRSTGENCTLGAPACRRMR
jgi:hypothetical protein